MQIARAGCQFHVLSPLHGQEYRGLGYAEHVHISFRPEKGIPDILQIRAYNVTDLFDPVRSDVCIHDLLSFPF